MSKQRRKQEELNYKACSKSKYFKMALWKKRKSINKASITHNAFKSLFRLQKACCLLTKTLIFNKVKRNSHDQVLYIINIGYVFLMILHNYMLPFWHGAYHIATGLQMSLESKRYLEHQPCAGALSTRTMVLHLRVNLAFIYLPVSLPCLLCVSCQLWR